MNDLKTLEEAYKLTMREALIAERAFDTSLEATRVAMLAMRAALEARDAAYAAWAAALREPAPTTFVPESDFARDAKELP